MFSSAVSRCEFPGTRPPNNIYTTVVCDDGVNAIVYSGYNAMNLPSNFPNGLNSSNFICCGFILEGVSYLGDYNITYEHVNNVVNITHGDNITNNYTDFLLTNNYTDVISIDNTTTHYTEFLSPDKYYQYSFVLNLISVVLSIVIIILYIIGLYTRGSENTAMRRYKMSRTRQNNLIPITNNLSYLPQL